MGIDLSKVFKDPYNPKWYKNGDPDQLVRVASAFAKEAKCHDEFKKWRKSKYNP